MKDIIKVLCDLNTSLMMNGYQSDYKISLSDEDFNRFLISFEEDRQFMVSYPDLNTEIKKVNSIKIAGPGCYFFVERNRK